MAKKGKRYSKAADGIDRDKLYGAAEAVKKVKEGAVAKFDETIELAMNLGVDPRHADQMVRGVVALPAGTGRDVRVAVFARDAKAEEARVQGYVYQACFSFVDNGPEPENRRCVPVRRVSRTTRTCKSYRLI